jgi:hypothetical protein
MRQKLIDANLWERDNGSDPAQSFSGAWTVLARLGAPCRFGGRIGDGQFEYLVVDPHSGLPVACGRGASLQEAMCQAALAARQGDRQPLR